MDVTHEIPYHYITIDSNQSHHSITAVCIIGWSHSMATYVPMALLKPTPSIFRGPCRRKSIKEKSYNIPSVDDSFCARSYLFHLIFGKPEEHWCPHLFLCYAWCARATVMREAKMKPKKRTRTHLSSRSIDQTECTSVEQNLIRTTPCIQSNWIDPKSRWDDSNYRRYHTGDVPRLGHRIEEQGRRWCELQSVRIRVALGRFLFNYISDWILMIIDK